jgi:hypothetical protein
VNGDGRHVLRDHLSQKYNTDLKSLLSVERRKTIFTSGETTSDFFIHMQNLVCFINTFTIHILVKHLRFSQW